MYSRSSLHSGSSEIEVYYRVMVTTVKKTRTFRVVGDKEERQ